MKAKMLMIEGIIKHLPQEIEGEHIGQGEAKEFIYKLNNHRCPRCQKDEWFYCGDAGAPFYACHSLDCMLNDSKVTKKQQEDRNIRNQKNGWFFKQELKP